MSFARATEQTKTNYSGEVSDGSPTIQQKIIQLHTELEQIKDYAASIRERLFGPYPAAPAEDKANMPPTSYFDWLRLIDSQIDDIRYNVKEISRQV